MFTRNGRKIQKRDFTKRLENGLEITGKKDRGIAEPNLLLSVDCAHLTVDGYQHKNVRIKGWKFLIGKV